MSDSDNNPAGLGRTLGGGPAEPLPSNWVNRSSASRGSGSSRNTSSARGGPGRMGTLEGMAQSSGSARVPSRAADDSDDDDDGKGESWFAGGERSGISIENPDSRRSAPGGNMVRDLLRRAAEGGLAPTAAPRGPTAFRGGGHMLGSDEVESHFIADPNADKEEETAIRNLTFWRNGFQVESGELMRYDDPQHAKILEDINAGMAPPALLNVRVDQPVELRVSKRLQEDYVAPKGTRSFGGAGHRLGDVSNTVTAGSTSMPGSFPAPRSGSTATPDPSGSSEGARSSFATKFEVDQTQPTTSIQIRLADGTRMVARMNLTHTVEDIRSFINASRSENMARPYTIGTTFPNRTLDDNAVTIQGAGLVNSVIVQRWV